MIAANRIAMLAALSSLALVAGCGSTADAPAGYASVEKIEDDPNRMVCRRQNDTGSRLSSTVCKTAREWEQERLDNQEAIRNATKSGVRPGSLPTSGGG